MYYSPFYIGVNRKLVMSNPKGHANEHYIINKKKYHSIKKEEREIQKKFMSCTMIISKFSLPIWTGKHSC